MILPLCYSVDSIYYQTGCDLGFTFGTAYPSPLGGEGWNFTDDTLVESLCELVVQKLLPEWERLSVVENCIEYLSSLYGYRVKDDGDLILSLLVLALSQEKLSLASRFISDWRVYEQTERGQMFIHTEAHRKQKSDVDYLENLVLTGDCEAIKNTLAKWYKKSLVDLGLSRQTNFRL